eukprot:PhF_6_TR8316/c0_g1_i1/m.12909
MDHRSASASSTRTGVAGGSVFAAKLPLFPYVFTLEGTFWPIVTIAGLFIEFCQAIAFLLNQRYNSGPIVDKELSYIMYVTLLPLWDPELLDITSTAVIAVFWILIAVILVIALRSGISVGLSLETKQGDSHTIMRVVLHSFGTWLYSPTLLWLLSGIICDKSTTSLYARSDIACWSSSHLAMLIVGIPACLALVLIVLITNTFLYEDNPLGSHYLRRAHSHLDAYTVFMKTALCVLYHNLMSTNNHRAFQWCAVTLYFGNVLLTAFFTPYYVPSANRIRVASYCCAAAIAAVMLAADPMSQLVSVLVLTIGPICAGIGWCITEFRVNSRCLDLLIALRTNEQVEHSMQIPENLPKHAQLFSQDNEMKHQLAEALNMVNSLRSETDSDVQSAPIPYVLEPYIKTVFVPSDVELATRHLVLHRDYTKRDTPARMLHHARRIYTKGTILFRRSAEVYHSFSLFVDYHAATSTTSKELRYRALGLCDHTNKLDGNLHTRYAIFRHSSRLSHELGIRDKADKQTALLAEKYFLESLSHIAAFWQHLTEPNVDTVHLATVASAISQSRDRAMIYFKKTLVNHFNDSRFVQRYGQFLGQVMLDTDAQQICHKEVADIEADKKAMVMGGTKAKQQAQLRGEDSYVRLLELANKPLDTLNTSRSLTSSISNITRSGLFGFTIFLGVVIATLIVCITEQTELSRTVDSFLTSGLIRTTSQQIAAIANVILINPSMKTNLTSKLQTFTNRYAQANNDATYGAYKTSAIFHQRFFAEPQIEYREYFVNGSSHKISGLWQLSNLITEASNTLLTANDTTTIRSNAMFLQDIPLHFGSAANESLRLYEQQNADGVQTFLTIFTVLLLTCLISIGALYILVIHHFQAITGNKTTTLQLFTMISHDNIESIVTKARANMEKLEGSMETATTGDDNIAVDPGEGEDDMGMGEALDALNQPVHKSQANTEAANTFGGGSSSNKKSWSAARTEPAKSSLRPQRRASRLLKPKSVSWPEVVVTEVFQEENKEEKTTDVASVDQPTALDGEEGEETLETGVNDRRKREHLAPSTDYRTIAIIGSAVFLLVVAAAVFVLSYVLLTKMYAMDSEFVMEQERITDIVNMFSVFMDMSTPAVVYGVTRSAIAKARYLSHTTTNEIDMIRRKIFQAGMTRYESFLAADALPAIDEFVGFMDAMIASPVTASVSDILHLSDLNDKAWTATNSFMNEIRDRGIATCKAIYDDYIEGTTLTLYILVSAFVFLSLVVCYIAMHYNHRVNRRFIAFMIVSFALAFAIVATIIDINDNAKLTYDNHMSVINNQLSRNRSLVALDRERMLTRMYVISGDERFVFSETTGNYSNNPIQQIPKLYDEQSQISPELNHLRLLHQIGLVMKWWTAVTLPNTILSTLNNTVTWNITAEERYDVESKMWADELYTNRRADEALFRNGNTTTIIRRAMNTVFRPRYIDNVLRLISKVEQAYADEDSNIRDQYGNSRSNLKNSALTFVGIAAAYLAITFLLTCSVGVDMWVAAGGSNSAEKDIIFRNMAARSRNSLAILCVVVIVILIVGHVLVQKLVIQARNMNDATSREWLVVQSMFHVDTLNSPYADSTMQLTARGFIRSLYKEMIRIRDRLYFTANSYNAVGKSTTFDSQLFGGVDYNTALNNAKTYWRNSCEQKTLPNLYKNLTEVDLEYLRWIQNLYTLTTLGRVDLSKFANDTFISNLQVSSSQLASDASKDVNNVFTILLSLLGVLIGLALLELTVIFLPIVRQLAHEQESTLLMLRMIPNDVRDSVPAISEFLETGKIDTTKEAQVNFEKSERLLQNILPQKISKRLKAGETPIADEHKCVTILFSDFVNFTLTSSTLSAPEVVEFLNEVFCEFDVICDLLEVEKIKTIGDAYFVVGGLDASQVDHAMRVVETGLHMFKALNEHNEIHFDRRPLRMRLGVHCGSAVAGVIGLKKVAYDLWGDAIVLANKMESSGFPMKVHISEDVYEHVKEFYLVSKHLAKGSGPGGMLTYLVQGRKAASPYMNLKRPKLMKAKITGSGLLQGKPAGTK